ncbi:MAG: carotenoid oxygenase family protein [Acidimicrobiia bacterium]|nr:carotenoid oxygenase family protein [Acidimicrobiia bacterium]
MLVEDRMTEADWRMGFRSLEAEIGDGVELEVDGTLPAELEGTLYRIGPARFDVYGERYRHWFDGDGMVHALRLSGGRAEYRNRFVATDKKGEEDAAGARIHGAFGTPPAGGPLRRLRNVHPKSAANTNVVFHGGKLLALWEAGRPWRLDPVTLETVGEDDLGGVLGKHEAISAHPKLDRATGEMWNFGVGYGPRTTISLYRTSADGVTARVHKVPLDFAPMVHDFALTATKAVFVLHPIALPRIPVGLMLGRKTFGDSLRWQPQRGTVVLSVDRETGEVRPYKTAPFLTFHTANAWDEDDDVVVDLCATEDDSIMKFFYEVMAGRDFAPTSTYLTRLRLSPDGRIEQRRLSDVSLEFPRVAGRALCQPHTRVYGATVNDAAGFLGAPATVDPATGRSSVAVLKAHQIAGEPVPVTKADPTSDDDVWLLALVLDAQAGRTDVWVLDGADVAAPPVAVVRLPHVVPFGFHGSWVRASSMS